MTNGTYDIVVALRLHASRLERIATPDLRVVTIDEHALVIISSASAEPFQDGAPGDPYAISWEALSRVVANARRSEVPLSLCLGAMSRGERPVWKEEPQTARLSPGDLESLSASRGSNGMRLLVPATAGGMQLMALALPIIATASQVAARGSQFCNDEPTTDD